VVQGARGGAVGQITARPAAGLAGEVARVEDGFTLARLVTGVWAGTSPASSRGGAGRRWPRAAPMPAMHGPRRMVRGGEVHEMLGEAWRWSSGSGVKLEGELRVCPQWRSGGAAAWQERSARGRQTPAT
jgi:hypothetical protein